MTRIAHSPAWGRKLFWARRLGRGCISQCAGREVGRWRAGTGLTAAAGGDGGGHPVGRELGGRGPSGASSGRGQGGVAAERGGDRTRGGGVRGREGQLGPEPTLVPAGGGGPLGEPRRGGPRGGLGCGGP